MKRPHFELFRGTVFTETIYFHLRAANGKILLQSEGYTTKTKALNGIRAIHRACHNIEDGVPDDSIRDLT